MRTIIFSCILFFSVLPYISSAQEQLASPDITVKNLARGESPVRISDVRIDIKVVGALAVTTLDMTFYNPNDRIMEGELVFPLGEGQSVSRFALDINGKLREGVVVEKAKGQAVFETTIRQEVDPGLLEKVQGNNFRTRVYPLPAKGTRRVVVAYEQELQPDNNNYRFFLSVEYKNVLDNFTVNLTVFAKDQTPVVEETPWGNFGFNRAGDAYVASYSATNYPAKGQLVFAVPAKNDTQVYVEKGKISGETVFYTQLFPEVMRHAKSLPRKIDIYWDASFSMSERNFTLETRLLDLYFERVRNVTVKLYAFNCIVSTPVSFVIKDGNWEELKAYLKTTDYDGATQMGALNLAKTDADEILLFSDGMNTLGSTVPVSGNVPVSVVTSSLSADHSFLKYMAEVSGGTYINLMQTEPQKAIMMLENENYRLVSLKYNKKEIAELTTSGSIINPEKGFSLAGKLAGSEAEITLGFGVGSRILETRTIVIDKSLQTDYGGIVEKVWAAKRIQELDLLYENNKEEIEAIGRKYNIVTRNTSLIVLENVQDYVRHKITPPDELRKEYDRLLQEMDDVKKDAMEIRLEKVVSMFEKRKAWWNKKFDGKKKAEKRTRSSSRSSSGSSGGRILHHSSSYTGYVSGVIVDTSNEPLPGVVVMKKNTVTGDVSNLDGRYTIDAVPGDVLVFSYIGMNTIEVTVAGSELNIMMEDNNDFLEEVVVVGYGNHTENLEERMAPQSVLSEDRETTESVSELITGTPQYIVDGVLMDDLSSIDPSQIESVSVFKDAAASGIYGSRGSDGVIVVSTRAGSSASGGAGDESNRNVEGRIQLNTWEPDTPYLKVLSTKSNEELYKTYLDIKEEYKMTPSFYLDVSALFEKRGLKEEAFVILTNLAEINVEDYRLLRVLAHRLKQLGYNEYAIDIFKKVLELRPEEPQSYRDLGLTYIQNKQYQEGIDRLYVIVEQEWDRRFEEIELFAIEEINNAIGKAKREKQLLNLKKIDKRLLFDMPVDIRIVLNWDTDNSDMDLWVTDPNGEKCYYGHRETAIGGIISRDYTDGYGPEEFLLKKALKGKYKIQADYYGSREQTIIGPTTIYLDIYTDYSGNMEKKETITLQLMGKKENITIGEIEF